MDRGEIQGAPKNFEALRALILERRRELPKRLAQVAAFALDNPDEIAFGTAASIATDAEVQPSTLVRFSQTFGFDGFSALQAVFRARLRERNSSYEDRLAELESGDAAPAGSAAILNSFIAAAHRSIDNLSTAIDPQKFELVEADHAGFRSLSASMAFAMALAVAIAEERRRG